MMRKIYDAEIEKEISKAVSKITSKTDHKLALINMKRRPYNVQDARPIGFFPDKLF